MHRTTVIQTVTWFIAFAFICQYGCLWNYRYLRNKAQGFKLGERSACARAKCMRRNVVSALADIVATKLGIILHLLSFSFQVLFSQKWFAYDFEFFHAFLSNKKNKIYPKKNGGTPPSAPKSSFLGGQQACEPVNLQLGGSETD